MINVTKIITNMDMSEVYLEMIQKLSGSDKVSNEDKEWIRLLFEKYLKSSEKARIQALYIQTFGKLPE